MMTDAGFFAVGVVAGAIYFALLRWNTTLYARGNRISLAAGLQMARLALLACALAVIAERGAEPLLVSALGVLVARPLVMRMLTVP
ncbi:MAG TPA: ATP synthase subunit I [Rhodopila sp.]|nr:ATP synthase subunit I [Rhodopila sp.]